MFTSRLKTQNMSLSRIAILGATLGLASCPKPEMLPNPYADEVAPGEPTCPIIPDATDVEEVFGNMQANYHRMLSETLRAIAVSLTPRLDGEILRNNEAETCWTSYFDCVGSGFIITCQSERPNGEILLQTEVVPRNPETGFAYIRDVEITVDPQNPKNNRVFSFTSTPNEHPSIALTARFDGPFGTAIDAEFEGEKITSGGCFVPEYEAKTRSLMELASAISGL